VVGGGRYDRLMTTLGASAEIPAIGAAIWCDRLLAQGGK
jgi:ATP phosphoribosyltransferase regulatory subunit